jgi:cytochrome P450
VTTAAGMLDEVLALVAYEQAALDDRWPIYERLRSEAPVFFFRDTAFVSRYEDVSTVLMDDTHFHTGVWAEGPFARPVPGHLTESEQGKLRDILDYQSRWMTKSNGERHAQLRRIGTRVFSPRTIAAMDPRIEALALESLATLAERDSVEFISEFAYQLPLTIICEMLDIPEDEREPLHDLWVMMTRFLGGEWRSRLPEHLDDVHESYRDMGRRLAEILDASRGRETTDLVSRLLAARDEEGSIVSDADLISIVTQILTAGHQTTQDLLGNALHSLLTHPAEWEALCANPATAADAVEEVLRYRSPAQVVERIVVEDVELAGVPLAAGQHLTCLLGSANHDPDQFEGPERFDIDRMDVKKHLAFARGPHFCLGAALSRLEGRIVLQVLAERYPGTSLVDDEARWIPSLQLLGLRALPLRLAP